VLQASVAGSVSGPGHRRRSPDFPGSAGALTRAPGQSAVRCRLSSRPGTRRRAGGQRGHLDNQGHPR
jgi:hypothetical protein